MSDATTTLEPARLHIPLASRVVVVSGLNLGPLATATSTAAADALAGELERWQGTGTLLIAGGLFAPSDAPSAAADALNAHGVLPAAFTSFLDSPGRTIVVIPCSSDATSSGATTSAVLSELGVELASVVHLECETALGTREVMVTAQSGPSDELRELSPEDQPWLEGIEALEEPRSARRFVTSRTLYRRLGRYLWVPPVVAVIVAVLTHVAFVSAGISRITRHRAHHVLVRVTDAPWHERLLVTALVVILAELIVGLVATVMSRRLFRTATSKIDLPSSRGGIAHDTGAAPASADQELVDLARAQLADGGNGVVVGGPRAASLIHLDAGFMSVPGASADVIREHQGRFGMPPVFVSHRQQSLLEIETGAELHVRLLLHDEIIDEGNWLERLLAGETASASPAPEKSLRLVASWPTGGSWPPPPDLSSTQRRARRIRRIAAVSLFLTGLVDLLAAVSPPLRARLADVTSYLPLGISQTAGAAVAIAGIALVMLSRGILRGQRRAWIVAVVLLSVSMVLHLAHAASFGAVVLTAFVLILLLVERRWFNGTTDRGSLRAATPVLLILIAVAIGAAFMGVELSDLQKGDLPSWPLVLVAVSERLVGLSTVSLSDRIDDYVYPVMLTVGIAVLVTVLYLVTRPVVDRRLSEHHQGTERRVAEIRARDIVRRHGRGTLDYFALRDDKQYFFYGDSLVAYAVYGGICLVSPDPIGPAAEQVQVWGAFRSFCDAHGWGVGVVGAGEAWLPIYDESGMRWLYLGDEAVVDVQSFSLEGGKMKGLRQANTRLVRYGYTIEFLDPATIDPARVPALVDLMSMKRRGDQERGFSMMLGRLFDPKDTGLVLAVVSGPDGSPVAMCQFLPSPAIGGYSLDLMRRDPGEHPNGLLDFALCQSIEHFRTIGATELSLNFAAFRSVLDGEKGDGITMRIERWGLRRLSSILPIETLWRFNEKYNPSWLARYLVYSAPEQFVPVVAAALRAESLTEIPVIGRFLAQDPSNRPGTVVPDELLEGRSVAEHDHAG